MSPALTARPALILPVFPIIRANENNVTHPVTANKKEPVHTHDRLPKNPYQLIS